MTYERIKHLVKYIPDNSDYYLSINGQINSTNRKDREMNKFIWCYKDLAFGYHWVKKMIEHDIPLPSSIEEEYLIDAYYYEKKGIVRKSNDNIVQAISYTMPCMSSEELALKAFLLKNIDIEEISDITSIPIGVITAYENLFFNIRDRKRDALFVSSVLYPNTRMVEFLDRYIENESVGNLILRASNKSSISDLKYIIGLDCDNDWSNLSSTSQISHIESSLMANAAFLNGIGLGGQYLPATRKAENMLIAVKQSGSNSPQEDGSSVITLSDSLSEALLIDKQLEMNEKASRFIELDSES